MEEEKKEECCSRKKFHHCCGHKAGRIILLVLAVSFIFSLGACFGSHRNYNREGRGERQFNFEQRGGRGMMNNKADVGGCGMRNEDVNINDGGCPMKNGTGAGQAIGGCMMQNQTVTPVVPAATSVKPVTSIK